MRRKLLSGIFLLTAVSIGLGAFGHGGEWRHVLAVVKDIDPHTVTLLALVWYWVSGTMLVFGVLLIWTWWRSERGNKSLCFVPAVIGIFYFIEGIFGAAYLESFFLIFAVQALLLWGTAWGLWWLPARRALPKQ